ncbi:MAG: hypothetical protein P8X96_12670 [Desulfobacteraceae bacterium]
MAIAMVIFAIFIGREQISPANYAQFLKSTKVSFTIFAVLCAIAIFFSMSRGERRNQRF